MQYALLIYSEEAAMLSMPEAETQQVLAAYAAYVEAMSAAGVLVGSNRLRPTSAATSVRVRNDKTQVLDGPYADTKEQLGGFFLIEAANIDAALSWAQRCPSAAIGTIEVRPIWQM